MPFQASFEVEAGKNWGFYEPSTRYILDTFQRSATSGTLGTSTNCQVWNTLAGTWYINGSYQAETDTAVTGGTGPYPLAAFDLVDINQLAYANVSPGMGIAFSIQNANNWWAITDYDYDYTYPYGCSTCCTSYNSCFVCVGGTCYGCAGCGTTEEYGQGPCIPSCCCNNDYATQPDPSCGCASYSSYCDCSYGTAYDYYLTILQCVNGTVNTINTISLNQDATSISLQLQNGTVNYYAYSTNISGIITHPYGLGTVLTSGNFTISGVFGTQIGMVKSPSYYIQGATISGFYGSGI